MEEVRVGLIGYGLAGSVFHAPLILSADRLHLATVASSRTEQVTRELPGTRAVATPEELFAAPDIELIVVASPNTTHHEFARRALRAGLDPTFVSPGANSQRAGGLATLTAHYGASEGPATAAIAQERRPSGAAEAPRTVIPGSPAPA